MFFKKLVLQNFGRFHNKEIELKPGLNLIYGENEAGKSTIHAFIKGMLFGIERSRGRGVAGKDDVYTRYLPWNNPGAFNGSMDISIDHKDYRIQRSFHANDKRFVILDLKTGREVKLRENHISELIPGLTESTFRNTVSMEQLGAKTDTELAKQLGNYIANLSISKAKEVDVAKALWELNQQRKVIRGSMDNQQIARLEAKIREGEEKEIQLEELTAKLKDLLKLEQDLDHKKTSFEKELNLREDRVKMEELPAIQEKFRQYQGLNLQLQKLEDEASQIQRDLSGWESYVSNIDQYKKDLEDAIKLSNKQKELVLEIDTLIEEREENKKTSRKNLLYTLVCTSLVSITALLITAFKPTGILIAVGAYLFAFILHFLNRSSLNKRGMQLEDVYQRLNKKIQSIDYDIREILIRNQVSTIEELSRQYELVLKKYYNLEHEKRHLIGVLEEIDELENRRDALYDVIMKYMLYFIPEEVLTENSMGRLREEINRRKKKATEERMEIEEEKNNCRLNLEKIRWQINALEDNEDQLIKNQHKYNERIRKHKECEVELEAINLALETIKGISVEIHDSFGVQFNQSVSKKISQITKQRYTDIKVDENLNIKVGSHGDYIIIDRLSAGTIDQLYFALRLAVGEVLLGKDRIPLILDDSFTLYDDKRLRAVLEQMKDQEQILLFSCHRREQEILKDLGQSYHYIDLNC